MVAEYQRTDGNRAGRRALVHRTLASHYLNIARTGQGAGRVAPTLAAAQRREVWTYWFKRPSRWCNMGFVDEAVAMIEGQMASGVEESPLPLLFLFNLQASVAARTDLALATLSNA